jgi:hypothetical protein
MTWYFNEVVRSGNSTARVKNFYPETGLIVLMDIEGSFEPGMTIIGDDSNTSITLTNFTISREYDLGFDPTYWEDIIDNVIYDGSGEIIALEEHFTGKPSQDYQTKYLVVSG